MTESWLTIYILLLCMLLAFAVIGFFDWMGLVNLNVVPCPCREAP